MKELLECLKRWLDSQQGGNNAREICLALAVESGKRAGSADSRQMLFDVQDIAPATESGAAYSDDYESAKRWFKRAAPEQYLQSRRVAIEAHFRAHGHTQALALCKTPSAGKHRTQWYYVAYDLPDVIQHDEPDAFPQGHAGDSLTEVPSPTLTYEVTPPDQIRLGWLGRLFAGRGEFATLSWRGLLWALLLVLGATYIGVMALVFWLMHSMQRPLTTGDLVLLIGFVAAGGAGWWFWVRPLVLLVSDRIVPAGEWIAAWREDPCQLEMTKTPNGRYIRVVRYSGTCPICSGQIELEYGFGDNRRRLFGCCTEAPREHVFTFDRVTLMGRRVE